MFDEDASIPVGLKAVILFDQQFFLSGVVVVDSFLQERFQLK
jgi:hypothetical protein